MHLAKFYFIEPKYQILSILNNYPQNIFLGRIILRLNILYDIMKSDRKGYIKLHATAARIDG